MSVTPHPTKSRNAPGKHWYIILGRGKNREYIPYSGTYEEACAIERSLRQKPETAPSASAKITDLIVPYYRHIEKDLQASTVKDVKWVMEGHLVHYFGSMQPKQITTETVDQYKDLCARKKLSKRSVNKHLSYLSAMIKWAAKRKYCHPLPFKIELYPVKKIAAEAKEVTPLKEEEYNALVAAIEPHYRLLVFLMGDMGLRREEALTLRSNNVDVVNKTITVIGKGAKKRTIPFMSNRVEEEIVHAIEQRPRGFLTVNEKTGRPYYSIRKALIRAAASAGIGREVDHHTLRHTFLSLSAERGLSPYALQRIAGHSDLKTTMAVYTKVGKDFVADEVARIRADKKY
jgi:integrase/recombinase XerD